MLSFKSPVLLFLCLSTLTGLVGAVAHPLMSMFIVNELKYPPTLFGLYTITVTLSGLTMSQWLASKADTGSSSLHIYISSIMCMSVGFMLYALLAILEAPPFALILLIGFVFIAMGNAAIPQMLTLARQWSTDNSSIDITQFNTRMRAAISVAWIAGPALGFYLVAKLSFSAAFVFAAACGVFASVFCYYCTPRAARPKPNQGKQEKTAAPMSFWCLVAAITLAATSNVLYGSAMPLYTINELGFSASLPGIFMATDALLEIPVMLLSARLAKQYSKVMLLSIAFVIAMVFYIGIFNAQTVWQFFFLQALNAIFYGLFVGLALSFLQEQLPERISFASTINSNCIKVGMMLGSTLMGFIAQASSFRYANLGALATISLALICLFIYTRLKQKERYLL